MATEKQVTYIESLIEGHLAEGTCSAFDSQTAKNYQNMLEDQPTLEIPATWNEYCELVHSINMQSLSVENAGKLIDQLKRLGGGNYNPKGYVEMVKILHEAV